MKTDISSLPISLDARIRGSLLEECCRRVQQHTGSRTEALEWGVQWLAGQGVTTSFKSLERTFYKFRKGGSLACIDRRKVYGKNTGRGVHQPRFKSHWLELAANCPRGARAAYEELKKSWYAGEVIPGYEKEWDRRTLPVGWSYENLCKLLPGKRTLNIYRKGITQAHDLLPQVLSTRAGSYPLQFVFFDDVWIDRICRHGTEINRAFQLGALDFCTGMRLSASIKFRHRRKDGTHVYFEQDDMLLAVAAFLKNDGYNAEKGTTLVVENGTAAISPEVEALLAALSGGKITVDRSGKVGMRQLLRGYGGLVKGNPRHKAPLESWHNLFHNRLCIGQADWAGKDRTPPETVAGIMKAEKLHLKNMADLPADRAALSIGHLLTFAELAQESARVTGEINRREDHALEGWQEQGFVSAEWTQDPASGMWGSMDAIADNPAMLAYVAALPETHRRIRRWSPLEAWNRTTATLGNQPTKFTDEQVAMLLSLCKGQHICRPVSRNGGFFYWKNHSMWSDATEYIFEARFTNTAGWQQEVPADAKGLKGVVNPMDPFTLYLFDANGVLMGSCAQVQRVHRDDLDAVRSAMGRRNARTADALQPLRVSMAPTEASRQNALEWNKRVADPLAPVSLPDMWQMADDKAALATAARRGSKLPAAMPAPAPLPLRGQPAEAAPSYLPPPDEQPGLADYAPSSFNPLI